MRDAILKSSTRVTKVGFDFTAGDLVVVVPPVNPLTITWTTNSTPVVISAVNELIENALVTIAGVEGNTAANGTHRARNVTPSGFALFHPDTNDPIAGNGDYDEDSEGGAQHAPTNVLTIKWNNPRASAEGLDIELSGLRDGQECLLRFLNSYLIAQGIPGIGPAYHFLILGERWDFVEGRPIQPDTDHGGLQLTTTIVVRKSLEINKTEASTSGFEWTS